MALIYRYAPLRFSAWRRWFGLGEYWNWPEDRRVLNRVQRLHIAIKLEHGIIHSHYGNLSPLKDSLDGIMWFTNVCAPSLPNLSGLREIEISMSDLAF